MNMEVKLVLRYPYNGCLEDFFMLSRLCLEVLVFFRLFLLCSFLCTMKGVDIAAQVSLLGQSVPTVRSLDQVQTLFYVTFSSLSHFLSSISWRPLFVASFHVLQLSNAG
jgi:hypothetical protein